ncbi:extracellular solute-binding protein [Roseiarcaceae bacterium H3SJ34-1]|uniref:ABC transporter substrate-binding protein n=1 Tax=Terripilifer ovatus TaxID=3032367 RepID=UPI003AB98E48|nr:extracellular solute-binding protein [Roseiarcaceae bacterium H3SJ34-1]
MDMMNRRTLLQLSGGAAAAAFLAPHHALSAEQVDTLYTAAKGEGRVVYYAAANENISKRVIDAFSKQYPGVKVEVLRLATAQLAQRFMSEHQAGNYANDLIQLSDPFVFRDAAKAGWLAPLSDLPQAAAYPAEAKAEHFATIGIAPHTIIFNTELVKEADRPKDWKDLLNPKWKGRLLLSDPRNNLEVADWLYMVYDAYGESYLAALKAQEPKYVPSILPGLQMLAAGDGAIIAPGLHQATMVMLSRGAPVADIAPALDSGQESLIAVCARAAHPNAARLLANFHLTPEGQSAYCAEWAASPLGNNVAGALRLSPEHKRARYDQALAERSRLVALLGL